MKMKYIYLFLTLTLFNNVKSSDSIAIPSTIGWGSALAFDCLSAVYPRVRHGLYGNEPVSMEAQQGIGDIAKNLNLQSPAIIKQAQWPWNAIAGDIFSNHDTLFISKKVNNDFRNLDNSNKKELIMSLLMIGARYDNKILALSVMTPAAIWTLAWFAQWSMKQLNCSALSNDTIKTAYDYTEKLYNSFKAKALISASLLGAYILYQRYHFGIQAAALMK